MKLIDSLLYKPVELPFGTSGLRGLVTDMTDLECYINTAGFLRFLAEHDNLQPSEVVYLAGDLRDSTPRAMQAVAAAMNDGGYVVVNCGKIPTPAVARYALENDAPCVMVSGSHIPADRNGIKFYKRGSEVLKQDEPLIKQAVQAVRDELYGADSVQSAFDASGKIKSLPELGPIDAAAEATYKQRYLDVFAADALAGTCVVVYQQSAVARDLIVDILTSLGAEVVPIERSDIFVPIDTENITEDEQARLQTFASKHPGSFAIVSADGDSDRPIVVDEMGEFHRGDVLGCMVATHVGAKFAAVPVSANDAVDTYLNGHNVTLVKTKIGSPYVIAAMANALADVRPAVSWEVNGGFLLGDDVILDGATLKALPTRDAMLPILCILVAARRENVAVSELFNRLPKRYTGAGLIDDVPESQIATFRAQANNQTAMQNVATKLFTNSNMGEVRDINIVDGLRIRFASNDVIHFRPSGNAPQFRVYTNADTQDHADELVRLSLGDDGYIMQLLKLVG